MPVSVRAAVLGLLVLLFFVPLWGQDFAYVAPTTEISYPPGSDPVTFPLEISIWQQDDPADETQAFAMGLANDSEALVVTEVVATGPLAALNDGAGPVFFEATLFADGWTLGVVYSSFGDQIIEFDDPEPVVAVTYEAPNPGGATVTSALTWADDLGMPPVQNTVVVSGAAHHPEYFNGLVTLQPLTFYRGDCDIDGVLGLADVIFLEHYLFLSGDVPTCLDACDTQGTAVWPWWT